MDSASSPRSFRRMGFDANSRYSLYHPRIHTLYMANAQDKGDGQIVGKIESRERLQELFRYEGNDKVVLSFYAHNDWRAVEYGGGKMALFRVMTHNGDMLYEIESSLSIIFV